MVEKAIEFLNEVKVEIKRVTWPAKNEALGGTAVVLIAVLLVAVFLGIVDGILAKIVERLIKV